MEYCEKCPKARNFNYGYKGENFSSTKPMLVLHSQDERVEGQDYLQILSGTKTGEILRAMLEQANLSFIDIYITNLVKCTFGRYPRKEEYENCCEILQDQIEELSPRAIIFFGSKPSEYSERIFHMRKLMAPHPSKIWAMRNHVKINGELERIVRFLDKTGCTNKLNLPPKQLYLF